MTTIRFNVPKEEALLIAKIVRRAKKIDQTLDVLEMTMDLTACHANGCPLDLARMAAWQRDFDVMHDVYGIARHLERDERRRNAGQLAGHFLPRFARPHKAA